MDRFQLSKYYAKMKFFKIFGNEIKIFNESGEQLLFFVKQKAFKLKEDITVFTDETCSKEILNIKGRSIIDFSAVYDVVDAATGERVGALRRKGMKSILRDKWEILNIVDTVTGTVEEDSMAKAILRRFLTNLVPQEFDIKIGGTAVGILKQKFNPFIPQFHVDFSMDTGNRLDRRMGIAIVIVLQVIEGRQSS